MRRSAYRRRLLVRVRLLSPGRCSRHTRRPRPAHPATGRYASAISAASDAAPPGSATRWTSRHSRRCASRIASSDTSTTRSTQRSRRRTRSRRRGAVPSGVGGDPADLRRRPAHRPRAPRAAWGSASGSTPTTRTSPRNHDAIPAISPPPPTATSTCRRRGPARRAPARSCPPPGHDLRLIERVHRQRAGLGLARARGNGGLVVVPGNHADVGAHARGSDRSWRRATCRGRRSRRDDRASRAAYATASPKFPPEAATTPASGTSDASILLNAPRGLNDPVCCSSSSFSVSGVSIPNDPAPVSTTGVVRTCPRMRSRADHDVGALDGRRLGRATPSSSHLPEQRPHLGLGHAFDVQPALRHDRGEAFVAFGEARGSSGEARSRRRRPACARRPPPRTARRRSPPRR